MRHPLAVALGISAAVHLAVLGVLLAARPRSQAASPMRVRVLGTPSEPSAGSVSAGAAPHGPGVPEPAGPAPRAAAAQSEASTPVDQRRPAAAVAPQSPEGKRAARTPAEPANAPATAGEAPDAERPRYQDDIWVLTDESPGGASATPGPKDSGAPGSPSGPRGALPAAPGPGTGGSGPHSLLGELSARLARSAARCTPAGVVRSSRGGAPEVPLHFCLDAAGRPSAVGLEGTTGSELLDRAARECVVPGAAPLPPLPGCYTVAVRFPVRG